MNIKLRQMRNAKGLSQRDFAKAIGKSFRAIQMWERGESFPNAEMIWRMCEFFDTDPNVFLGWYDEHPRRDESLSQVEHVMIQDFRACTPARRQKAADAVRDQRKLSSDEEAAGAASEEIAI